MAATSILCRCGRHLRIPDCKEVVAKCPSCGRTIDYIADDLPASKLDKRAYKRLLREGSKTQKVESSFGILQSASEITVALLRASFANFFWILSGLCITVMLGACLYFFSLTFEPSDAQLNYEMAVQMKSEGRQRESQMLLEQIVDQAPRSRWALRARNMLAEMPGSGISRTMLDAPPQ